jgi:hypothetical protein
MALRNHRRLAAAAVCVPLVAAAAAFASSAGDSPAVRTVTVCPDQGYSRAELMNVVNAYRRSPGTGRIVLRGIDHSHYWASYDRCET